MRTRTLSGVVPTYVNIVLSLTGCFSQKWRGENLCASLQDIRRLFSDVKTIRDGRDMRIGVCGFDLENCRRFTQRQAHGRSYTRLITPLSSRTLFGWKVDLVTLGFGFDGIGIFVPD